MVSRRFGVAGQRKIALWPVLSFSGLQVVIGTVVDGATWDRGSRSDRAPAARPIGCSLVGGLDERQQAVPSLLACPAAAAALLRFHHTARTAARATHKNTVCMCELHGKDADVKPIDQRAQIFFMQKESLNF